MEEEKIQQLHDTLSKLRKGKGLGTSSHYNFGNHHHHHLNNPNSVPIKEGKDGKLHRDDGLPINALYSNFVKQGSWTKKDSALKYGDGRVIKRNFDDCIQDDNDNNDSNNNDNDDDDDDSSSNSSNSVRNKTKESKRRKKELKKATKKAEKLEAKKKVNIIKVHLANIIITFSYYNNMIYEEDLHCNHVVHFF